MNDMSKSNYFSAKSIGLANIQTITDPTPSLYLHCAIFAMGKAVINHHVTVVSRLLSDETFRLTQLEGQESVSELFEFELNLHGNTSSNQSGEALTFEDVIGRPITVGIQFPSEYNNDQLSARFQSALKGNPVGPELALFNGIVASFTMEVPGVYRIGMKPALWKLSLTNAYVIHKQKSVKQAISDILDQHRIAYNMDAVSGNDNLAVARVQDWLQAGETDLDFIRRLMSKAHLYYFFKHSGNSHQIIFVNRPAYSYPYVFEDKRNLRYTDTAIDELGMAQYDIIASYSYQRSLTSSSVEGVFTRQEAAWEDDAVARFQSYRAQRQIDKGDLPFHQYKIYQYGCSKAEITHFNDATSCAVKNAGSAFSGSSFCAHFRVGHQFRVIEDVTKKTTPKPVQASLNGKKFVLTMVKHQASADGTYQNQFQSSDYNSFISPFSMQETQQGAVLAQVVEPSGNVSTQDWRHYTKDFFAPGTQIISDSEAANPNLSAIGVYVRFSTDPEGSPGVWVKLAPSMQTVPEIGVTVLVTKAQDESELPEIQSIIQANGSLVIMPSTWTANTHVGSSYSTNYGDGKSIRFGKNSAADLSHAVSITDSAYDTGFYRDTSYSQGASYSFACSESNATQSPNSGELYGPYAGASDILGASESFGSNYSRQYAQVMSSFSNLGVTYSKSTIGKSESYTTTTGTTYSENTHGGDITSITTINANTISTSTQVGNVTNTTTQTGNTTNTSTQTGNVTSTSLTTGNVTSSNTTIGVTVATTVNTGNVTSHNTTTGDTTSVTVYTGNMKSTNTNTGNVVSVSSVTGTSDNTATYDKKVTSTTTHNGPVSSTTDHHGDVDSTTTHYDNVDSTSTIKGDSTNHSTVNGTNTSYNTQNIVHNFSTTVAQSSSSATAASNSNDVLGVNNKNSAVGASLDINAVGVSINVNAIGSSTNVSLIGNNNTVEMIGPGFAFSNKAVQPKIEIIDLRLTMIDIMQIYL